MYLANTLKHHLQDFVGQWAVQVRPAPELAHPHTGRMRLTEHGMLYVSRCSISGIVLYVVGLIKYEDCIADVYIHSFPDDRIYEVVVWTEYQLSFTYRM